jgi:hypothetical protein
MRRFLRISTRNDAFHDSRNGLDTVPVTVLREPPALLRCSLLPIPADSVLDTIRTLSRTTFADYVMADVDLLVHAMEKPLATLLYELLRHNNTNR